MSPELQEMYEISENSNNEYLWSNIRSFYQKGLFCDVELICYNNQNEKKSILCHRLVLASASSFFKKILSGTENSDKPCLIYFTDYKYQNIKCIIDNIYKALDMKSSFTFIQGKLNTMTETRTYFLLAVILTLICFVHIFRDV